ncbi:PVV-CTERM domain-containing choice-of-anchor G protein [Paenarthrobacter aurescens]|uniref:PVV-CTERM domain-containing choice-of-anchor G protein n=1 Tax=Paenarthrobacter aurescens TaxID=43663 RepID=UPI0021C13368|nr:choice-of-anchor G family protein [Paenarthrobacter aurescens]MCT9868538.1 choice-of-anchor G family protein [Paenarthrobacter aurescens]
MNSKSKLWPTAVGVTAVSVLAIGLVAAPAANAAPTDVISVGSGQIIDGSVLAIPNFAGLAANGAATAEQIGTPPSGPAIIENSDPLDLSAVFGVVNVGAGNIPLLQNNGIIQVGAVSQYGKAVNDGSSEAFSGTVSGAPGLVTLPAGLPTSGDPAIPAARITAGTAAILGGTDLVNVTLDVTTLAAAAKKDQGAAPQGAYAVAGVSAEVGGTIVGGVAGTVSTAINTANAVLTPLGVTVVNPVAGGTIAITEADLLAAAGVADLNSLPAGTDLVSFLPQAVATKLTSLVSSTLATATTAVNNLGPLAQLTAGPALALLTTTLNGVTGAVATSIVAPLGTALTALVSAKVNVQETAPSGAFTQRALQVGIAGGSIATVNLANATVGPNLDAAAIPLVNADTMAISGGVALLALLTWLFVRSRRRSAVAAA